MKDLPQLQENLKLLNQARHKAPKSFSAQVMLKLERPNRTRSICLLLDRGLTFSATTLCCFVALLIVGSTMYWRHSFGQHCLPSAYGGEVISVECVTQSGADEAVLRTLQLLGGKFGFCIVLMTLLFSMYAGLRKRFVISALAMSLTICFYGTHFGAQVLANSSANSALLRKSIVTLAAFENKAEDRADALRALLDEVLTKHREKNSQKR